jgi:hypothetical protein
MTKAFAILLLSPALAIAAEKAPEKSAKPKIIPGVDWVAKTIKATGRGAPALDAPSIAAARIGAEKVAEIDAVRNILAVLQGVRITSDKTVGDAMRSSDTLKAKLEGEARGFRRVDTRYFSDGGVEIDVEMSIEGLLAELAPQEKPAEEPARKIPTKGKAINSGLVIDAKGLNAKPALAPRILDEVGAEVYAAWAVEPESLKSNGIAGYLKSVDEAKKSARVGEKPLVLKAFKLAGVSDLVLSNSDAAKLRDPEANLSYLSEGRVIIVAD